MNNECMEWLNEVRDVFPRLNKKIILAEYKKMSNKKLGLIKAKVWQKLDVDSEALLLGKNVKVRSRIVKPKEFNIYVNQNLQKIINPALRKEVVHTILIHELLHIEAEDLITLSKNFNKRKKKKIHINDFEEEVFQRYNKLRDMKGIMKIEKKEHLDIAINRILESINWYKK